MAGPKSRGERIKTEDNRYVPFNQSERETSDRWQQSLTIERLAEEAWAAAQPTKGLAEASAPQTPP
jgi:hypothetical protein